MPQLVSGPTDLDLSVYAGDANVIGIEIYTEGGPVDTTGATITAQARTTAPDPAIVIEAVITVVDPVGGRHVMSWDGEVLRTVLAGQDTWAGVWDFQVLWEGATLPHTLLRGKFTIRHDVTRVGP